MFMKKNAGKIAVFLTVFFIIICYQWFFTAGKMVTKWPRAKSYYDLQSRAFLSGQLHLLELPRPELLALSDPYDPFLNGGLVKSYDLTLYDGKYYLNWGPVPALIISVLHLVFTTKPIYDSFIVFGFVCGLLISNTLLILWLRGHIFTKLLPGWVVILAILLVGLGHPIPWLLGRPAIYEAAIIGGQFFLMSGLYWAISALEKPRPHLWRLFLAGTSWALVVGTRISLLITVLFFVITVIYVMLRQAQKNGWLDLYPFAIGCIIGPLLLSFLLLGLYNGSRFGSFFETGVQYTLTGGLNQYLLAQDGKLVSTEYVLPNLINYVGNGIGLKPVFPYLAALPGDSPANQIPNFNFRLEALSGIIWVLPFALFSLLPIIKFLAFIFQEILSLNRDLLGLIRSDAGLLHTYIPFLFGGGALFAFLPLLTFYGATMRYEEDFVPLLMLLSILGFWSIFEKYHQRTIEQRSIMIIGAILSLISIIIAFLLGITSYLNHFETHNYELMNRVRTSLAVKLPFFLTDGSTLYYEQADLIWQNKDILLWKWNDEFRIYLTGIKNPNGLETINGQHFFWMGGQPTQIWLATSHPGIVKLTLDTTLGPSLPDISERHLRVRLPDGSVIRRKVLPGKISLEIPVESSKINKLSIRILDSPTVQILPNGDRRPLLMGIKNIIFDWLK